VLAGLLDATDLSRVGVSVSAFSDAATSGRN
jgi:hypothetical protein